MFSAISVVGDFFMNSIAHELTQRSIPLSTNETMMAMRMMTA
jgi:hypothetical protein